MLETFGNPLLPKEVTTHMVESISRKDSAAIWLAGAIDGEGCFSAFVKEKENGPYKTQNLITKLTLANTHPAFIRKATECLCELEISFHIEVREHTRCYSGTEKTWKPCAAIVVAGQGRMRKLLPLILPHLSCKKPEAELLKNLLAYREVLRMQFAGGSGAHRGGSGIERDELIVKAITDLGTLKWEHASVLDFSRKPNQIFGS